MNSSKLEKVIPWGDAEIQKYYFSPKDKARYVILNDGSWQFVENEMVKMYGPTYEINGSEISFKYTMIVQNPQKNHKLTKEEGSYELYLTKNLFGWNEKNVHYYDYSVLPWDCDDRIYVDLFEAKLNPETCTEKYKKTIHDTLSKPFSYNSKDVARYYTNLRTGEAYIFLTGGAWQFLERNDDTGTLFISEYGINYFYDDEDSCMDMDIFCSRESEFDEWTFNDPDDDDSLFTLYEFQNFFGKDECYISYHSETESSSLDTMFFEIVDYQISPDQAKSFFNYDVNNGGEFAISNKNINTNRNGEELCRKKFGLVQTSIAFALVILLVAGFYYLVLKIIPDEFDKDQLIFFSGIWALILTCFIFPFLSAKNQYIEISKNRLIYSNMFGKKTELKFKDILGIKHCISSGKTGSYIMIFPKNANIKLITFYARQYKNFNQIDEILTNNLDEISLDEYFEYCAKYSE